MEDFPKAVISPEDVSLYDPETRAHERAYNAAWVLAENNAPEFMNWVWGGIESREFTDAVMAATSGDGEPFVAMMQNLAERFAQQYAERNWDRFTHSVSNATEAEAARWTFPT